MGGRGHAGDNTDYHNIITLLTITPTCAIVSGGGGIPDTCCGGPHVLRHFPRLTLASLAVRRANALKSAGPHTARGRDWSSLNGFGHDRHARHLREKIAHRFLHRPLRLWPCREQHRSAGSAPLAPHSGNALRRDKAGKPVFSADSGLWLSTESEFAPRPSTNIGRWTRAGLGFLVAAAARMLPSYRVRAANAGPSEHGQREPVSTTSD